MTGFIQDCLTMIWRELRHTVRFPLMLVSSVLVPVVMLLLFTYVLGGVIGRGVSTNGGYVTYLVPGILVMTVAAGCSTTAINVCTDSTRGVFDRLLTMPVSRAALLAGHVGGAAVRALAATLVLAIVACAIGFRGAFSPGAVAAIAVLLTAFALALGWVTAALGLQAKTVAGANGSTLPLQFVLPF